MNLPLAVTVERDAGLDEYGDAVTDYPILNIELTGCWVAPSTSADIDGRAREGATDRITLRAPYGSDILPADKVRIDGGPFDGLWEVDGDPANWRSPLTGRPAGLTVALNRARG